MCDVDATSLNVQMLHIPVFQREEEEQEDGDYQGPALHFKAGAGDQRDGAADNFKMNCAQME